MTTWRTLAAVAIVAALTGCGKQAAAAEERDTYRLVEAFPKLRFERPLWLTHAGDGSGRLFVVEQDGRVHVFAERGDVEPAKVFLDIHSIISRAHNEEGLLALAFHPGYSRNGLFYVYYSAANPRRNVLARYQVSASDPGRADPASGKVLLEIEKPYGNHNGSTLLFGRDGYLYLSTGDGGSAGDPHRNGQNLGSLLAKILRIDVDHAESGRAYGIPSDNPFLAHPGARGEIWAYGLRNVWRMSFDRATGDLWAGDVGQDRWEEIDLVRRGGNYGWNLREGKHLFAPGNAAVPLLEPVVEYGHDVGASVTGGYVYRGERLPELRGAYLYADYVTGTVWALRYAGGRVVSNTVLVHQPKNIASFGEDAAGEVFLLVFDGAIYQLAKR